MGKQDRLQLDLKNGVEAGFFDSKDGQVLDLESFKQKKPIRLQMEDSYDNRLYLQVTEHAAEVALFALALSLLLYFFMSSALD